MSGSTSKWGSLSGDFVVGRHIDNSVVSVKSRGRMRKDCYNDSYLSRDCPDKKMPNIPRKMKGKELYTHVHKDEFFADAAEEGF